MRRGIGIALAVVAVVVGSAEAGAWDCWGGWDPSEPCTSQASSCGSCQGCCTMIFDCRVLRGRNYHVALTEYSACSGHCLTDWCS